MSFSLHRLQRAHGRRWGPSYLRGEGALVAWWRAGDLADGVVTGWVSRGLQSYTEAQATAGLQPTKASSVINGKPAVTSDGVDDHLVVTGGVANFPASTTEGYTAVVFSHPAPASVLQCIYGYGTTSDGQQRMIQITAGNQLNFSCGGGGLTHATPLAVGPHFAMCRWVSGAMEAWLDGAPTNPATAASTFSTATTRSRVFSSLGSSPGSHSPTPTADIFILNNRMTTLWRQKLEGWAFWEYGIVPPVGHPYEKGPP